MLQLYQQKLGNFEMLLLGHFLFGNLKWRDFEKLLLLCSIIRNLMISYVSTGVVLAILHVTTNVINLYAISHGYPDSHNTMSLL